MKSLYKFLLLIGLLVITVSSIVLAESSHKVLINKIHETLKLDREQYTIELLTDELKLKGYTSSQFSVKPLYDIKPLGRFAIVAKVEHPDGKIQSEQIRIFIRKYAEVVVVSDRITRFHDFSPDNLSIQRREVTGLRETPVTSLESLTGMRARRNINRDDILTKGDIEPTPVVNSYSDVHIVYVDGLCRVSAAGKALEDGLIGELIRVKNKSSGKIVIARVVDKNSVTVDP
jgi:flagella basal body P-ring formation protein FlgA